MTVTIKNLANGQLSDTTGDLYEVAASTTAITNTITFVNTHTIAVTINLYLLPSGGTARNIIPIDLSLAAGYCAILDSEINLDAGDKLQGDASVADKVDYTIGGLENA